MIASSRPSGVPSRKEGDRPSLLFLCVANSARSQMAEGLARDIAGDQVVVQSAGSHPGGVHPFAIEVMDEIGVDLRSHRSKSVNEIDPDSIDYVITLCAEEHCPVFLGDAVRLHWEHPDPAALSSDAKEGFRRVRDLLRTKITTWLEEGLGLTV